MKSLIRGLIAVLTLRMIALAAPVGVCLHAYGPEAPADKIECFEFEKIEKVQSGKRFFLSNGTSVIITDYRNRGVVLYPAGLTGSPESLATLLATYETYSNQTPSSRPFLNPWILKLRNNKAEVAKQVEKIAGMPSVTLPDGTVLEGCKANKIVDDVVYLIHSYGTKKIKLADLSEATQKALKLDEIQKPVTPPPAELPTETAKSPVKTPESHSTAETVKSPPKETENGDAPLSVDNVRIAAENGDADAQYRLGLCYEHGKGVTQSLNEAIKWYQKAADQESPVGQYLVGHCYDEGKGVQQDFHEAVKWYRLAADNGNAIAQLNLGTCYFKGEGVVKDLGMAAAFWQKAAEQGIPMAQLNIGNCYAAGAGVKSDKRLAYMWCDLAAAAGVPAGAEDRETIAKIMTKQELAEAQKMVSDWHPKPNGILPYMEPPSIGGFTKAAKSTADEPTEDHPSPATASPIARTVDPTAMETEADSTDPKARPDLDEAQINFAWPPDPSPGGAKLQLNGKAQPINDFNENHKTSEPGPDKKEYIGGDSISGLRSGITSKECYEIFKSYRVVNGTFSNIEFNNFVRKLSYDHTLSTGDIINSILVKSPKNLSDEISCVALGFINDKLYRITHIYEPKRYYQLIPKDPKYSGHGNQERSKKLEESWNEIISRTLDSANRKFKKTTKPYLSFVREDLDPNNIFPGTYEANVGLFNGFSKNVLAQISYVTQNESEFGRYDSLHTMTALEGDRVIIENFYFLDIVGRKSFHFDNKHGAASSAIWILIPVLVIATVVIIAFYAIRRKRNALRKTHPSPLTHHPSPGPPSMPG